MKNLPFRNIFSATKRLGCGNLKPLLFRSFRGAIGQSIKHDLT
jgi:hypothetical protein